MIKARLLLMWVLAVTTGLWAAVPNHTRLIYSSDLKSDSAPELGTIQNYGGEFTQYGWRTRDNSNQLRISFQDFLPHEGTVEFKIYGLNWSKIVNTGDFDWTLVSLWSRGSGSFFDVDKGPGSYFMLKADQNTYDAQRTFLKALTSGFFGDKNRDGGYPIPSNPNWDASKWYTFKIVWGRIPGTNDDRYRIWVVIDDEEVAEFSLNEQIESFGYLFLGRDNDYESAVGVTYADLKVYAPQSNYPFQHREFSTGVHGHGLRGGQGVALPDINGDEIDDFYVSHFYSTSDYFESTLFSSTAPGQWQENAAAANLNYDEWSYGSVAADFDNDGDQDIFSITYNDPDMLLFNDGSGNFSDVSASRGISSRATDAKGATLIDLENDGDEDIIVVNSQSDHIVYVNDGSGNFTTTGAGLTSFTGSGSARCSGAVAADLNADGYQDVVMPVYNGPSRLFINRGNGTFDERAVSNGFNLNTTINAVTLGDIDQDGDLDIVAAESQDLEATNVPVHIFTNDGSGRFTNRTNAGSVSFNGYGLQLADFNNDGDLDMIGHERYMSVQNSKADAASSQDAHLARFWENDGIGNFTRVIGTEAELITAESRAIATLDFDDDGFLDFFTSNRGGYAEHDGTIKPVGRNALMRNDGASVNPDHHYLKFAIYNENDALGGLGSRIYVYRDGQLNINNALLGYREVMATNGYNTQSSWIQHVGVGTETTVDVKILFPDGSEKIFQGLGVDQQINLGPNQIVPAELVRQAPLNPRDVGAGQTLNVRYLVQSAESEPVANFPITATVTAGGGSINGNTTENLTTDSFGEVIVPWKIGPTAGVENRISVTAEYEGAELSGSPDVLAVVSSAAIPSKLTLISGNNQTGTVNAPLQDSLLVQVTDAFGNPFPGLGVEFAVAAGGGTLSANGTTSSLVTANSNANGMAAALWTLGSTEGQQNVQVIARYNGAALQGSPMMFSATATAPQRILTKISGDDQTASVFQELPQPLRVKLEDMDGSPISGQEVIFVSVSGDGNFSGQPSINSFTNSQGIAQATATLGSQIGEDVYVFEARAQNAQGSPATFTASGLAGPPAEIEYASESERTAIAGRRMPDPLTIRVYDAFKNPIADHPVIFTVTQGNGDFEGSKIDTVLTDASGYGRAYFRPDETVGSNTVVATAAGLASSSLFFTIQTEPGPPAKLVNLRGSGQVGDKGAKLSQPFVVSVTDSFDNKIDNHPVTFQVESGGGNLNGAQQVTTNTVFGEAAVFLTLGPDAYENTVTAFSVHNGMSLSGSPTLFRAFSGPGEPDSLIELSGNYQKGRVSTALPKPFRVKVIDQYSQGVPNVTVEFVTIIGGGYFVSNENIYRVRTDENGVAEATAVIGSSYGINNNTFEANASYEGRRLQNSPVIFYASGRKSTARAMQKLNGQEPFTATVGTVLAESLRVKVVDDLGQSVANHPVTFDVQGNALLNQDYFNVTQQTNRNGVAAVSVYLGPKPGRNTITASSDDGVDPLDPATLTFYVDAEPGAPDTTRSSMTASTDIIANGQDSSLVNVMLRDKYDNPIVGETVILTTTDPEIFIEQPKEPTDNNGHVEGVLSSTKVGAFKVWAMVNNQAVMHTTVRFIPGEPAIALQFPESIRGEKGKPFGPVGVTVKDMWSHVVPGIAVRFSVVGGGGSISNTDVMQTDSTGRASVTWTLGHQLGANAQHMVATVEGLDDSVHFYGTAIPPQQGKIVKLSGDSSITTVGQKLPQPLAVQVFDDQNVPISDINVDFQLNAPLGAGQGIFVGANPVKTDGQGKAQIQFQAGTRSGPHVITASAGIYGEVIFSAIVQNERTIMLAKLSQDGLSARPNFEMPLMVKAQDVYGRPLEGELLNFVVQKGNGFVQETLPIAADADGIVSVTWRLGTSGEQQIQVVPENADLMENVYFTAMVQNNPPYFDPPLPAFQTVVVGDTLRINFIRAVDPEDDQVFYSMDEKPSFSQFYPNQQPAFVWVPRAEQMGKDTLVFRATDQYGAYQLSNVVVNVEMRNDPPLITGREPESLNMEIKYNTPQQFIVYAEDPNGDELTYQWTVNNIYAGNKNQLDLIFTQINFPNPTAQVRCVISDGMDSSSLTWVLGLVTAVELSSFEAATKGNAVKLDWRTSREINSAGFYILRSLSKQGPFQRINEKLIKSRSDRDYSYEDTDVEAGRTYYYKLRELNNYGHTSDHGLVEAEIALPKELALAQNYPNPFNPSTTIRFDLPESNWVTLTIYNVTGQQVRRLASGRFAAGVHSIVWDATDDGGTRVPSGVYHYRMRTKDGKVFTKKLLLLK